MLQRLSRSLFGKKKNEAIPPVSVEEACAYLLGENEEEIILALDYIEGIIDGKLPSSACLTLLLNCLNSDSGNIRQRTYKVFQLLYGICDMHYNIVRRKVAKEIGMDRGHAGATRAALNLINSMDVPYRVQYVCSKLGAESIRKGTVITDPEVRAEVFIGVGKLLPVVWWYLDCSGDTVDALYRRSVSVFDKEELCDWSAEEGSRIRDDALDLCYYFYTCCTQSLIREATTTDSMGNTIALEESAASFHGSSRALLELMRISNLKWQGLSLGAVIIGLLAIQDIPGSDTVLPTVAFPTSFPGSISTYSGVHHSLLCHTISNGFNDFVQIFIHTCIAYMTTILERVKEIDPSQGVGGLLMVAQALHALMYNVSGRRSSSDDSTMIPIVQILAKVKEKYRFGDEQDLGGPVPASSEPQPLLEHLVNQWASTVMLVLTNTGKSINTALQWALAKDLVEVMRSPLAVSVLRSAGPQLHEWLVRQCSNDVVIKQSREAHYVVLVVILTELLAKASVCDNETDVKVSIAGMTRAALFAAIKLVHTTPGIGTARVLARCVDTTRKYTVTKVSEVLESVIIRSYPQEEEKEGNKRGTGVSVVAVVVFRVALVHLHSAISVAPTFPVTTGSAPNSDKDCSKEVLQSCLFLLDLMEIFLGAFRKDWRVSRPKEAGLLAWFAAAQCLSSLFFTSALSPGSSCESIIPASQYKSDLRDLRRRLSVLLLSMVDLCGPRDAYPSDSSIMLLRLLCRHALPMAMHTSSTEDIGGGDRQAEGGDEITRIDKMQTTLITWLEAILRGSYTMLGPEPTQVKLDQGVDGKHTKAGETESIVLPKFGGDSSNTDTRTKLSFRDVVPSSQQLEAPALAADLCLSAYFRAVSTKKDTGSASHGNLHAVLLKVISQVQTLLSRYCEIRTISSKGDGKTSGNVTHAMLVDVCSQAKEIISIFTGVVAAKVSEDVDSSANRDDTCVCPPSPGESLQLRGAISDHWSKRGGKDGTIMISPLSGSIPASTNQKKQDNAFLAQSIRRLGVDKKDPVDAIAAVLTPTRWATNHEIHHFCQPMGGVSCFVHEVELVAAVDDEIGSHELLSPKHVTDVNTAGDNIWDGLDELPEPPTSRLYTQLGGSGDLLTVLGSCRYDSLAQYAEFFIRICNSSGFTIPSLQLRGTVSLLGAGSIKSSTSRCVRRMIAMQTEGSDSIGNVGSDKTREMRGILPQQLESPLFTFLGEGEYFDHVFRIPCTDALPIQLSVTLLFDGLVEETNGTAEMFSRNGKLRLPFNKSSSVTVAPMTLPSVAFLKPYGYGMWSYFSRTAWIERNLLWTEPQQAVLHQLPSKAMSSQRMAPNSKFGVPSAVFEMLWRSLSSLVSTPSLVPLRSPVAEFGEEIMKTDEGDLFTFVDQAIALADAGAGGAALSGAHNISSAARVILHDPIRRDMGLYRKRLAWALESQHDGERDAVCVLVSIWTVKVERTSMQVLQRDKEEHEKECRVRIFAEAEVRSSSASLLASLTGSNDSLDSLLRALTGDTLVVDAQAKARMRGNSGDANLGGLLQRETVNGEWALASALRGT